MKKEIGTSVRSGLEACESSPDSLWKEDLSDMNGNVFVALVLTLLWASVL